MRGDCTFDDSQGLYFLDMNFSTGLTYNEVLNLVNVFLAPDPDPAVIVQVYPLGTFDDAIELLGSTNASPPQIIGITDTQSSSGLWIGIDFFSLGFQDNLQITANFYSDDGLVANAGHWLVLSDPAVPAPEPGTLALFGLGLAAMGLSRRRKKI